VAAEAARIERLSLLLGERMRSRHGVAFGTERHHVVEAVARCDVPCGETRGAAEMVPCELQRVASPRLMGHPCQP
jgi:hypothetical protein